jgi:beta-glucosidase
MRKRVLTIFLIAASLLVVGAGVFRHELRTLARDIKHSPTRAIPQGGAGGSRFDEQHRRILNLRADGPFDVIFLGDSITEFWLEPQNRPIFDEKLGHLRWANFGVSSDATQNVLWRITAGGEFDGVAAPRLVVLMIGTNNTPTNSAPAIVRGVARIIDTIRARFPNTKILLLSILPRERGGDPINARIRATNSRLALLHDARTIHFLDLSPQFADADGRPLPEMLADGLHLSVVGYEALGGAMRPAIDRLLASD